MVVCFDLRVVLQVWARSLSLEPVAEVELEKGGFLPDVVYSRLLVEYRLLVPAWAGLYSQFVVLVWGWCSQGWIPPIVLQWYLLWPALIMFRPSWELC